MKCGARAGGVKPCKCRETHSSNGTIFALAMKARLGRLPSMVLQDPVVQARALLRESIMMVGYQDQRDGDRGSDYLKCLEARFELGAMVRLSQKNGDRVQIESCKDGCWCITA